MSPQRVPAPRLSGSYLEANLRTGALLAGKAGAVD